jgi:hypothetical protein
MERGAPWFARIAGGLLAAFGAVEGDTGFSLGSGVRLDEFLPPRGVPSWALPEGPDPTALTIQVLPSLALLGALLAPRTLRSFRRVEQRS